ncbi:zinc ribbon domain-containing protein [Prevotella sp. PINT]|jgi:Primosomal protein N'' (replication factor Y) - superfamily II helicase|uniref:zinc ribbon domain-containing protein n=1 Tax=Palleniella intestinalis TaxID=2736291 RepID=UPI001557B0DC|nr:zinc ribbon domain-containing protein [Palleniella intestinalis]NPD81328.1 zinc ribbon domain-containing protein [Palleniella intestinalis]
MIIKCPECGRQVSDKAPTCPSCGVEIAGKVTHCHHCGHLYFTADGICPNCHAPKDAPKNNTNAVAPHVTADAASTVPATQTTTSNNAVQHAETHDSGTNDKQEPKKGGKTLAIAFVFATVICLGLFYFYSQAQSTKEEEDYEFAMRSKDPEVLQNYLLRYNDAPEAHRDSIEAHLIALQKGDEEWNNAILSNSRQKLQAYLDTHPESVHRQEALVRLDSLDWVAAKKSNSEDELKEYTVQHPDGRFIDEANVMLSKILSTMVHSDEKEMVTSLFRQFFQSINSKDESRLTATVGMVIDSFLGKSNATAQDVVTFMRKIYKDDVDNMVWRIDPQSYKIEKREIAENEYEYSVSFSATQDVERNGSVTKSDYRVSAMVSNDGKISGFNLTKLN